MWFCLPPFQGKNPCPVRIHPAVQRGPAFTRSRKTSIDLVDGPGERQPGALTSREGGALVAYPGAVASWQRLDVHIQAACFQHPPVSVLLQLQTAANQIQTSY